MFWTTPLALMIWSIGVTAALAQANDHKGMNDSSLWIETPTRWNGASPAGYRDWVVVPARTGLERHPAEWARHAQARMA